MSREERGARKSQNSSQELPRANSSELLGTPIISSTSSCRALLGAPGSSYEL